MSIFDQNWFHIVGNTFSDFCANIFQNLPNQSGKNDFFYLKSAFSTLRLNFSRTKQITAKPMILSYVGHFYKHLTKIKKILREFFSKR